MAITTIDGWTLTEIDTISGFKAGLNLFELDEVQNFALNNTEETKEITGKGGTVLNTQKNNKAVKGSGTNGLLSGGMMGVQTGSTEKTTGIKIKYKDVITVTAEQATAKAVTLSKIPSGTTAGAEVQYLFVKDASTGVVTKYEQATTAGAGKFVLSNSTTVTFPTDAISTGDIVYGWYETAITDNTAVMMTNDGDNFSGEVELVVSGLAKNNCGTEAEFQIIVPRADFVGNWDLEIGDNQTVHKFEFTSLKNACSTIKKFWDFIIFDKLAA